jgi:cytochrome P450
MVIAPWVLHRHERLWPEPGRFDPARFLPGAPPPPRFAYLPFGAGPRVCIGAQFALTEATVVLATLARAFDIDIPHGKRVLPVGVVTVYPDRAPTFRLRPRSPAERPAPEAPTVSLGTREDRAA